MITQGKWEVNKHATPDYAPQQGYYIAPSRTSSILGHPRKRGGNLNRQGLFTSWR